ncbi:MAG: glycosyl hydrolase family 18 protein [Roseburia sp.]|nr:glycosyl hydrolase family 18 protein [Roseburia sp.]MCM1099179.1 glycosyl hydrolase family 18 protein [Ruminococcus flavefaciens]
MKKVIPVIVALLLIALIAGISFGGKLMDKYSYSKETADLDEYYGVTDAAVDGGDGGLAIILQDGMVGEQAVIKGGVVYFDLDTVHTYFNEIYYADREEQKLLLTTADDTLTALFGQTGYSDGAGGHATDYTVCYEEDGTVYIAADYVRLACNYTYEVYDRHLQVYTEWGVKQTYDIAKNTQLRVKGGIKSPILRELEKGEVVELLEQMETWSKVKTSDAMIGYVENKRLTNVSTELENPAEGYVPAEYTSARLEGKVGLGWHAIYGAQGNDTLDAMIKEGKGMNVIAPTWFSLTDSEGNFQSFASAGYVEKAHKSGLKVWGVWDDFNAGEVIDSYHLFSATTRRQALAQRMLDTTLEYGLDGINLDFEKMSGESRPHFNQFLRELSVLCRKNGVTLSVDNYVPLNSNNSSRLDIQGQVADYVIIMGYDEHWGGSQTAGSVASIDFVSGGIDRTLEQVAAEKVINALPFYTRVWKTEGTKVTDDAIPICNMADYLKRVGKEDAAEWDETTCQNYLEWQSGDVTYQIWLEDVESLRVKLNVMSSRKLGGAAVWRLGYGTSAVWELVAAFTGAE